MTLGLTRFDSFEIIYTARKSKEERDGETEIIGTHVPTTQDGKNQNMDVSSEETSPQPAVPGQAPALADTTSPFVLSIFVIDEVAIRMRTRACEILFYLERSPNGILLKGNLTGTSSASRSGTCHFRSSTTLHRRCFAPSSTPNLI